VGSLAPLAGEWAGDQGLEVAFHRVEVSIVETPERQVMSLKPFGPVENGSPVLYGLDYRTAIWRFDEENPFHTEVGYWLWAAARRPGDEGFVIPAARVRAGGPAGPDDTTFTMTAERDNCTWGRRSNPYLEEAARTAPVEETVTVAADGSFAYEETTFIQHARMSEVVLDADRTVLRLSQ
jgi:hypothetical protein